MSLRERTHACTCMALLVGDSEHEPWCPALACDSELSPVVVELASADGQRTYQVTLDGDDSRCTCAYFLSQHRACKHILALRGDLSPQTGRR